MTHSSSQVFYWDSSSSLKDMNQIDRFCLMFQSVFLLSAGISFTPKEVGEHVVSVKKNGKHVTNSPFKIMVGQSEIGDASKVKVYGQGLVEGHTFEVAEFIVDTRNAGKKLIELLLDHWLHDRKFK